MGTENDSILKQADFYILNEDGTAGEKIPNEIHEFKTSFDVDYEVAAVKAWARFFESVIYRPKKCRGQKRFIKLMMSIGYSKRKALDAIKYTKLFHGEMDYQWEWLVYRATYYRYLARKYLGLYMGRLEDIVIYGYVRDQ